MKTKDLSLIALAATLPVALQAVPNENGSQKGVFMLADFLYWRAQEEGLDYAISGIKALPAVGTFAPVEKGETFAPQFKFTPGLKVGAGYSIGGNRQWDVGLTYTWLNSCAKGSRTSNLPANLSPSTSSGLWPIFGFPDFSRITVADPLMSLSFASALWRLYYQTLDLEIARSLAFGKRFRFKPHLGLRAASINQKYDIRYIYSTTTVQTPNTLFSRLPFKNKFRGIGIRGGLDNLWQFSPQFGVFANVSASVVYGKFHVHQKQTETKVSPPAPNFPRSTGVDISSKFYKTVPEFDIALGLHGETSFRDRYKFEARIGWEHIVWFQQNQLYSLADFANFGDMLREKGNLTLGGLTIEAKLHF